MKNLGEEIRKSRQFSKLTAKDLAAKIGVDPTYITYIEKHGKIPPPAVMKKIEDALDDPMLGDLYLRTKYPEACKEFEEGNKNITDEFLKSVKIALKKGKTPEERKEIKKRLDEHKTKLNVIVAKFAGTIKKLEDMEESLDLPEPKEINQFSVPIHYPVPKNKSKA